MSICGNHKKKLKIFLELTACSGQVKEVWRGMADQPQTPRTRQASIAEKDCLRQQIFYWGR